MEQLDVMPTLIRRAELSDGLTHINPEYVKPGIQNICEHITEFGSGVVFLYGLKKGKSSNAAALMLSYFNTRRYIMKTDDVGLWVSVHQMCYQNRTVDRYNRDYELQDMIRRATKADFLVLDGMFPYITQNDDLLLQAIYDARQHKSGITVVTTSVTNPLDCAGSIMYRLARDARYKEEFK